MKTLTVRKGSTNGDFTPGWHTMTISKAKYGEYNESKFIEVWFKGYSENFTLRVYAKTNDKNEEWAIGQLFRFADAGISDALDGPDGETIIKYDDSPEQLIGKHVNVYLYKDGKYSRALKQVAPTVFENQISSFTEADVEYWKSRAEKYYVDYVQSHQNGTTDSFTHTEAPRPTTTADAELPF